jgi:hypothetical protein
MNGEENQRPSTPAQTDSNWSYRPQQANSTYVPEQSAVPAAPEEIEVTWSASEYIARHKGSKWYLILIVGTAILATLIYLLFRDFITVVAIVFAVILFGVSAGRKPRILTYRLNTSGLTIGQKFYPYPTFKSFSVIEEGPFSSISLWPLRRFMPPISIYYEPADEEQIVAILARHLPVENRQPDAVDHLMRSIRF